MSLKDKLRKISEADKKVEVDIPKIISQWQHEVEKTLNETKVWFKEYIDQGIFTVIETEKSLNEEIIGDYKIKMIEYEIGKFRLVFEPMGHNIIGAWGRIDVFFRGNKTDKYVLILLGEKFETSTWFLSSFQNKSIRIEFNKVNVEKLVEEWIDKNSF
jgi:hypothetical protein